MNKTIRLSTGTEFEFNRSMIGINIKPESDREFVIANGYDSEEFLEKYDEQADDYIPIYTKSELIELANIVINRWNEFKDAVTLGKIPTKDKE